MKKSKLNTPTASPSVSWVVSDWQINGLVGRLLTLIEAMGFPQKQEEALKGLVQQNIWEIATPNRMISFEEAVKVLKINESGVKNPPPGII